MKLGMNFNNSQTYTTAQLNMYNSYLTNQNKSTSVSSGTMAARNMNLSSAMINRVHTTKPGCSACGKGK